MAHEMMPAEAAASPDGEVLAIVGEYGSDSDDTRDEPSRHGPPDMRSAMRRLKHRDLDIDTRLLSSGADLGWLAECTSVWSSANIRASGDTPAHHTLHEPPHGGSPLSSSTATSSPHSSPASPWDGHGLVIQDVPCREVSVIDESRASLGSSVDTAALATPPAPFLMGDCADGGGYEGGAGSCSGTVLRLHHSMSPEPLLGSAGGSGSSSGGGGTSPRQAAQRHGFDDDIDLSFNLSADYVALAVEELVGGRDGPDPLHDCSAEVGGGEAASGGRSSSSSSAGGATAAATLAPLLASLQEEAVAREALQRRLLILEEEQECAQAAEALRIGTASLQQAAAAAAVPLGSPMRQPARQLPGRVAAVPQPDASAGFAEPPPAAAAPAAPTPAAASNPQLDSALREMHSCVASLEASFGGMCSFEVNPALRTTPQAHPPLQGEGMSAATAAASPNSSTARPVLVLPRAGRRRGAGQSQPQVVSQGASSAAAVQQQQQQQQQGAEVGQRADGVAALSPVHGSGDVQRQLQGCRVEQVVVRTTYDRPGSAGGSGGAADHRHPQQAGAPHSPDVRCCCCHHTPCHAGGVGAAATAAAPPQQQQQDSPPPDDAVTTAESLDALRRTIEGMKRQRAEEAAAASAAPIATPATRRTTPPPSSSSAAMPGHGGRGIGAYTATPSSTAASSAPLRPAPAQHAAPSALLPLPEAAAGLPGGFADSSDGAGAAAAAGGSGPPARTPRSYAQSTAASRVRVVGGGGRVAAGGPPADERGRRAAHRDAAAGLAVRGRRIAGARSRSRSAGSGGSRSHSHLRREGGVAAPTTSSLAKVRSHSDEVWPPVERETKPPFRPTSTSPARRAAGRRGGSSLRSRMRKGRGLDALAAPTSSSLAKAHGAPPRGGATGGGGGGGASFVSASREVASFHRHALDAHRAAVRLGPTLTA